MGILARTVVTIPILAILIILGWVTPIAVSPIVEHISGMEAVSVLGWDFAVDVVVRIGVGLFLVILAGISVLWWIFGSIREDVYVRDVRRY